MASKNQYPGLENGPITHSAVDNFLVDGVIAMGDVVQLVGLIDDNELLPRVEIGSVVGSFLVYGIAVGGDEDGTYGSGSVADAAKLEFQATSKKGQTARIVSRGKCPARVFANGADILIGDKLAIGSVNGTLSKALTGNDIIAVSLGNVTNGDIDMIPVEVVKEGRTA